MTTNPVDSLRWPERPTCHVVDPVFVAVERVWREPNPDGEPYATSFRTCSYCGSIHPGDLFEALGRPDVRLEGADRKYGWPHKFYVQGIPNLKAGQTVRVGSDSKWDAERGQRVDTPILGPAPATVFAKFYTEHLIDEGYGDEAREGLIARIEERGGVRFRVDGTRLEYRAGGAR